MVRLTEIDAEPGNGDFIVDPSAESLRHETSTRVVRVTVVGSSGTADFGDDLDAARTYAYQCANQCGRYAFEWDGARHLLLVYQTG